MSRFPSVAIVAATCLSALGVIPAGCAFRLEDLEMQPASDASTDGTVIQDGAAWPDGAPDAAQDAAPDAAPDAAEVCSPPSDQVLCALLGFTCGSHQTVDACGQSRNLTCGSCGSEAHCEQGVCLAYSYAWSTGTWSACSKSCGGGLRTRDVQCKRDDGQAVADAKCAGTKPAPSEPCNSQPCCTTPTLAATNQACAGGTSDIVSWIQFHYGSDTGSTTDRANCAAQCTAWAVAGGLTNWCCDLVEDSTTGTSWSCAAHTGTSLKSHTNANSKGSYAGLGSCQSS